MEYSSITYEKNNHIALVTLNRPEIRNAWSPDLAEDLSKAFAEMKADDDVRVVIMTGNGPAFSAGAYMKDPNTHRVDTIGPALKRITEGEESLFDKIYKFPKPVIVGVNGFAVGAGFQIVLCSDILIASEDAQMGMVQITLGLIPAAGGSLRLARYVGKAKAAEMILTGRRIGAQEALDAGLVVKVVPRDELMSTLMEYGERIAALPPLAPRLAKESLNSSLDIPSLHDAALADHYRFAALGMTADSKEAHQSWREKRKPVFTGE